MTPLLEERGRTASSGRSRGIRAREWGMMGVGSMSQSLDGSSITGSMGSNTVRTGTGTGTGTGRAGVRGPGQAGIAAPAPAPAPGLGGGRPCFGRSMGTLATAKSGS